jgi:ABC-2 type transport system permease protein
VSEALLVRGDRRVPIVRAVLAQAAIELRLLVRSSESLIITLGLPLGILTFFSVVDVLPTGEGRAVDFLVPGVLALSVGGTGLVAVAIQTAFERKYAVLKRLGASPLPRGGFLVAKAIAVAAIMAVQGVLVLVLALGPLGWRPAGSGPATVPVAVALTLLGALACTSTGLALAGTLRAEATLAGSNALFLVLIVVSGVTFDAGVLPAGLARVGAASPVGALGAALRAVLAGDGIAWVPVGWLAAWAAAATAVAARWFRWEP